MANEDKKDFHAMMHNSKDMPKIQIITDEKSIARYGGSRMYFAPPLDYDKVMKTIPFGKVITVGAIREHFAKENKTPYWRTLKANGELNPKFPGALKPKKKNYKPRVIR